MTWNEIYENNKLLDNKFYQKYGNNEETYKKNCIELLVEIGEFVNETKCFKYWSIKKPNKNKMLEELADVFTMILYFYSDLNMNLKYELSKNNNDIFELINDVYYLSTKLLHEKNKEVVKEIFVKMLYISNELEITEEEILDAIYKKHKIIEERFEYDY